MTEIAEIS